MGVVTIAGILKRFPTPAIALSIFQSMTIEVGLGSNIKPPTAVAAYPTLLITGIAGAHMIVKAHPAALYVVAVEMLSAMFFPVARIWPEISIGCPFESIQP